MKSLKKSLCNTAVKFCAQPIINKINMQLNEMKPEIVLAIKFEEKWKLGLLKFELSKLIIASIHSMCSETYKFEILIELYDYFSCWRKIVCDYFKKSTFHTSDAFVIVLCVSNAILKLALNIFLEPPTTNLTCFKLCI